MRLALRAGWMLAIGGLLAAAAGAQEGPAQNGPAAPAPIRRITRAAGGGAKPPPVNVVVSVGQSDSFREQQVVPIRVRLDNVGATLSGWLEVRDGRGRRTLARLELPRSARKEYWFYLPLTLDENNTALPAAELLVRDGARVVVRQPLAPRLQPTSIFLLSCTNGGAGLQFLTNPKPDNYGERKETPFRVNHAAPEDLPRQWPGYSGLDAVALTGQAWGALDDEQRRALRLWVNQGGRAILCGENSNEWTDPDGRALAGVTPRDLASLPEVSCLADWGGLPYRSSRGALLTVSGPLAPHARALLTEGGRPLAALRECGEGQVLWLGFDPFRETVREWPGAEAFWRRALETVRDARQPLLTPPLDSSSSMQDAALSLPRLPAPPLWVVALFGLLYAAVFGPVNVWILRRLRRTVRSWFVMPSLALAMSLALLALGQAWVQGRAIVNEIALQVGASGGRTVQEYGLVGLFSPTNRTFDVAVDDPAPAVEERALLDQTADPDALRWPDYQEEGGSRWESLAMQLYAARILAVRRPRDLNGVLEARVGANGAATVRNGAQQPLEDAYLWRPGGQTLWIGRLAPGETRTIASGWSRDLRPATRPEKLELLESRRYRERLETLWAQAPAQFLTPLGRRNTWLIARPHDPPAVLSAVGVSATNRGALLLLRADAPEASR